MSETANERPSSYYLIAFYRELAAASLPEEIVADLMHQAGSALLLGMGGVTVDGKTNV